MDPTQNTGSFGAGLGGIDSLKAAMQRRGMDSSILDQVSGAAPTGPSEVAPPMQGEQSVMPSVPQEAVSQATGQEAPFESGELELSLKALKSVVDTSNAIKKSSTKLQGI